MKLLSFIFSLILFVSISPDAYCQTGLLQSVQTKYNSFVDFTVDFKQIVNGQIGLAGKFSAKNGNKIRLETAVIDLLSDGKTNWSVNKRENKVVITNYDNSDVSLLSIKTLLNDYPGQCSIKEEGNSTIIMTPQKGKYLNFKKITLGVSNDKLITTATILDNNNATVVLELTNYSLNSNLDDSKFAFTPSGGIKVVDLR